MGVATRRPLELTVEAPPPEKVRTGALVVGAFADGTLPPPTRKIDEASKGRISAVTKLGDLGEKPGASLPLYGLPGVAAERVLLVSLGRQDRFGDQAFRDSISGAARALADCAARDAAVTLADRRRARPFPRVAPPACEPVARRWCLPIQLSLCGRRCAKRDQAEPPHTQPLAADC